MQGSSKQNIMYIDQNKIYREVFFKLGYTADWIYDWDLRGQVCIQSVFFITYCLFIIFFFYLFYVYNIINNLK